MDRNMKLSLDIKLNLLQMTRLSYQQALFAGTSGNLSVYDHETGIMAITPSSIAYETMGVDDIMLMKLDGEIIEGNNKPSSEWRMHAVIYKNRTDIKAIIHTHSPYATSFAVNDETIPIVLIEMVPFLGGEVSVARFALPGTDNVGLEALKALEESNACLLANHGVLAIGDTLERAHIRAVYVEDAARIYSLAKSNGAVRLVPQEAVAVMKNRLRR
jgi:L-ribulose-5-phosphate 4-epimerase